MPNVHLRRVAPEMREECIALRVADDQLELVASNAKSLEQADTNAAFTALAVYDRAALGYETPETPMVGFVMLEIAAGVGFIQRLMIDRRFQGRGYGRAAMREAIRRLRLSPDVEMIATSHLHENAAARRLYDSIGFVPWDSPWAQNHPAERYLMLPE